MSLHTHGVWQISIQKFDRAELRTPHEPNTRRKEFLFLTNTGHCRIFAFNFVGRLQNGINVGLLQQRLRDSSIGSCRSRMNEFLIRGPPLVHHHCFVHNSLPSVHNLLRDPLRCSRWSRHFWHFIFSYRPSHLSTCHRSTRTRNCLTFSTKFDPPCARSSSATLVGSITEVRQERNDSLAALEVHRNLKAAMTDSMEIQK